MASIKDTSLVIQAPRQGISLSPHIGFADVRNIDITTVPGIAQLNNILVKKSGSTVVAQINWLVRDPVTIANIYALDSAGQVYTSTDSGATWATLAGETGGGSGQGMLIWKDYLFVARATAMDLYGPLSSSPLWRNTWAGLTMDSDTLWHPMIHSKINDKLEGGAGRYIFTIVEAAGKTFTWNDATTYTATARALSSIPSGYRIKCLEELSNNLMIGTWQGTNVYDIKKADIFTWDSSSVQHGQPVIIADFGVHAMLNFGGSLIVLAGISGTIYKCDGVNAYIVGQLPMDLSGGKYLEWYPNALCSYKNKVFFGVGQGGTTAIPAMGVYSLQQTGKGNILNFEHTISTLNDGTTNPLKPSSLLPITRDTLLVAWRDNATYGIDLTTATSYAYTTNYSGYFDSPLYVIGDVKFLVTFTAIELRLAKALATGEGIQLKYRTKLSDSFTAIKTPDGNSLSLDFATLGAVMSTTINSDIPATEMLQIRVEMQGTATTTPQFKSLRLVDYFIRGQQSINQKE